MSNLKIGLFAAAFILGGALVVKSCDLAPPLVIPDWADSLANVRDAYTMDSVYWAEQHEADSLRAETYKGEAESWRRRSLAVRPVRPPRVGTTVPDSGSIMAMKDSLAMINALTAQNDSLWQALDLADSAFANLEQAFTAQRQATADAMAGWARADSALDRANKTAERAINSLIASLKKAQRGCRVLWVISCPEVTGGYGAVLQGGQVHHGPGIQIGMKIRLGGH